LAEVRVTTIIKLHAIIRIM